MARLSPCVWVVDFLWRCSAAPVVRVVFCVVCGLCVLLGCGLAGCSLVFWSSCVLVMSCVRCVVCILFCGDFVLSEVSVVLVLLIVFGLLSSFLVVFSVFFVLSRVPVGLSWSSCVVVVGAVLCCVLFRVVLCCFALSCCAVSCLVRLIFFFACVGVLYDLLALSLRTELAPAVAVGLVVVVFVSVAV